MSGKLRHTCRRAGAPTPVPAPATGPADRALASSAKTHLHAVADAEDREAEGEDALVKGRRLRREDGVWPSGDDDASVERCVQGLCCDAQRLELRLDLELANHAVDELIRGGGGGGGDRV